MRGTKAAGVKILGKERDNMAARVDEDKCTGCGSCVEVCPVEAITVEEVATINADECLECGACVDECPNEAISLD
ncbi:indolepyruvate ferredoxin oxidoreductase subunit alpha [Neomoorella mulderi]|nr:4Fe-4S binding protein [Moorella mulderi]